MSNEQTKIVLRARRVGKTYEHQVRQECARFFQVNVTPFGARYRVIGSGRRTNEIGTCVATIGLCHSKGYEVALRFEDGKLESFNPYALVPAGDQVVDL